MTSTLASRRRLLAAAVVATPFSLATGNTLFPAKSFQMPGTTAHALETLTATAGAPGRVLAGSLFEVVGFTLLAVTFAAVASLVRSRGGATATAAAVLGVVGSVGGILVTCWLGLSVYAASRTPIPQEAKAAYLVSLTHSSGVGMIGGVCFLAGLVGGSVLLAVSLFRSGRVARWICFALPLAVLFAAVFAPQGPAAMVMALPLLVVAVLLARELGHVEGSPSSSVPSAPVIATAGV
jgi:hypothetical protein